MHSLLKLNLKTLIAAIALCSSTYTMAQDAYKWEGNTVTFHGNRFDTKPSAGTDTLTIIDPINGDEVTKILHKPNIPIAMNGKKIYSIGEVAAGSYGDAITVSIEKYLLDYLKKDNTIKSYADGSFRIDLSNIVINEQGHVVYYALDGFRYTDDATHVTRSLNTSGIDSRMMYARASKPVTKDGKNVLALLPASMSHDYRITVKNHVVTCRKTGFTRTP